MGWSYGWASKEALVRELLENKGSNCAIVDKALNGNHLWVVMQAADGKRFIYLFLLGSMRDRGVQEWGYKGIEDSCGPSYYDCPERLLAQTDDNANGYAPKWREECREMRGEKCGLTKFIAALQPGDKFVWQGKVIEFLYRAQHGRRGAREIIVGRNAVGGVYRYPKKDIRPMAAAVEA